MLQGIAANETTSKRSRKKKVNWTDLYGCVRKIWLMIHGLLGFDSRIFNNVCAFLDRLSHMVLIQTNLLSFFRHLLSLRRRKICFWRKGFFWTRFVWFTELILITSWLQSDIILQWSVFFFIYSFEQEIASMRASCKEHRAKNENLKRIKVSWNVSSITSLITI